MNKTCKGPCWGHWRLQYEDVGSRCVKYLEKKWGVINNGQGAAERTAGDTGAFKWFSFYQESELSQAEELKRMF